MTHGRWAWSATFVVLLAVSLSVRGLSATGYAGWPALGLVVGLYLVVGRRRHRYAVAAATIVTALAITRNYDHSPVIGLLSSLAVTLPAEVTWRMLVRRRRGPLRLDLMDNSRYHAASLLSSLLCAAVAGIYAVLLAPLSDVPLIVVQSFLSALTSQLVILPLFLRASGAPPAGRPAELWAQRLLAAALTLGVFFLPTQSMPVLFAVFPALAWAAIRASRLEAHLQLFVVCMVAYTTTYAGLGPFQDMRESLVDFQSTLVYLFIGAACYLIVPLTLTVEKLSAVTARASAAATTVQRLFDAADRTILVATDRTGRITHFNSGAEEALGYRLDEVLGKEPGMFYSPGEASRQAAHFGVPADAEALTLAQATNGERRDWVLRRRDGSDLIASLTVNEVLDSEDALVGFIAAGEDVTERARAQEALRAALEREHASLARLQEVDEVKQELVSNVSHELRTPITSISGYAELLADGAMGELTGEQLAALRRIQRNTSRLGLLVEDLLTMSRAESGKLVLHRDILDLCATARDALELLDETSRSRPVELRARLSEGPVLVRGDRHALERVVVNLLSNALKFTPDLGKVTVHVRRRGAVAELVVEDTGIGIPEREHELLFQRFYRAPEATRRAIPGTGLGLSIVHAIVTEHEGTVAIDSRPGAGTLVTVLLPLAPDVAPVRADGPGEVPQLPGPQPVTDA